MADTVISIVVGGLFGYLLVRDASASASYGVGFVGGAMTMVALHYIFHWPW